MKKAIVIIVWVLMQSVACCAQGWFELGTGVNALNITEPILTMCTDTNGNLYAAGSYLDTNYSVTGKFCVSKWDKITHTWSEVGTGLNKLNANGIISSICIDKFQNIYAAGAFTDSEITGTHIAIGSEYVAKWNGSTWSQLGTGANSLFAYGTINSICVDNDRNVYAAGNFRNSYGESYVAKWNGIYWRELSGLNANLFINSICVDDSLNVYAGGTFSDPDGHKYIAKYCSQTGSWSELGVGFDSANTNAYIGYNSIIVDSIDDIYAAVNYIHDTTGITFGNIFKWDGATWNQLGGTTGPLNANNYIDAICFGDSGFVYAAGAFTNSAGQEYVAKYDPQTGLWSELGGTELGANSAIYSLCIDKYNNVFAGGDFNDANGHKYVAEYGISNLEIESIVADYSINVYPNPIINELNIVFNSGIKGETAKYYIYDCMGNIYGSGSIKENYGATIDLSGLLPGIYSLSISGVVFKITKL